MDYKTIGFIGLGRMGLPMSLNLCRAGFEVLVCSGNPDSAAQVEAMGGRSVPSYQALARQADVVITIVPADEEIRQLYLTPDGLLDNMRPGAVCIDMTTAQGETMLMLERYIKEHNLDIKVIDAPVSGGVPGAVNGTLSIIVGCESKQLCDSCMPIFQAMGQQVFYTGGLGCGSNIKMINQMVNAANTAIAAEAICLAKQLGIDLDTLCQVINQSSGRSYVFERNVPHMVTGDHTPGFRLALMEKDVGLFMAAARSSHAFTPVAEMVYQIYKAASNQGNGERNYTCIQEWLEQSQGK